MGPVEVVRPVCGPARRCRPRNRSLVTHGLQPWQRPFAGLRWAGPQGGMKRLFRLEADGYKKDSEVGRAVVDMGEGEMVYVGPRECGGARVQTQHVVLTLLHDHTGQADAVYGAERSSLPWLWLMQDTTVAVHGIWWWGNTSMRAVEAWVQAHWQAPL